MFTTSWRAALALFHTTLPAFSSASCVFPSGVVTRTLPPASVISTRSGGWSCIPIATPGSSTNSTTRTLSFSSTTFSPFDSASEGRAPKPRAAPATNPSAMETAARGFMGPPVDRADSARSRWCYGGNWGGRHEASSSSDPFIDRDGRRAGGRVQQHLAGADHGPLVAGADGVAQIRSRAEDRRHGRQGRREDEGGGRQGGRGGREGRRRAGRAETGAGHQGRAHGRQDD